MSLLAKSNVNELLSNGATLLPSVLSPTTAKQIKIACTEAVDTRSLDARGDARATAIFPDRPAFVSLIEIAANILRSQFNDVKFYAGAVTPKIQGDVRKDWHVDSWLWRNSDVWREVPPQVGVLFYLDYTGRDSGELLIVPGSHRRNVFSHQEYMKTKRAHPSELSLSALPGDVVILDARTMHATSHNLLNPNRICVTLWFMLEYSSLQPSTQSTVAENAVPVKYKDTLEGLFPEYGNRVPANPLYWPYFPVELGRIDALRHGKLDIDIVGDAAIPSDTFMQSSHIYNWYRAIGCAIAPRLILELGVRYGYSAIALIDGANWAGVAPYYVGIDGEIDGVSSSDHAVRYIRKKRCEAAVILPGDTRNVDATNASISIRENGLYDLVHIDADHSPQGILNEIAIAECWVKPDGYIIVDDVDTPHVNTAALALAAKYGITPLYIPTTLGDQKRGMMLVNLKMRTIF